MFVVGLTGGIGSGKTAATDYLAQLGITIVDADLASRVVVEPGQPALQAIAERFGNHLIAKDGALDRRALREIVFADPDALKALEGITHPAIGQELQASRPTPCSFLPCCSRQARKTWYNAPWSLMHLRNCR